MTKKDELKNQISLYSLETKDLYNNLERNIGDSLLFFQVEISKLTEKKSRLESYLKKLNKGENTLAHKKASNNVKINSYVKGISRINLYLQYYTKVKKELQNKLKNQIKKNNYGKIRMVNSDALKPNKVVALFDSTLTRVCKINPKKITDKLFIIRAYHYSILESIILKGFYYNGEHYKYFTSSAGQIRTKKIVCIESKMFKENEMSITCGLTEKKINDQLGVNMNKYQAYLALINSASAKWSNFDINKTVVVDDMATPVHTKVDFIDEETFQMDEGIEMELSIEHMDGCGIMLPSVSDKTFMFRMPWVKGMLVPFDFKKFAIEKKQTKIKDVYGKEYDIIEDDIQVIMTKSQFKMKKYYESWSEYKENFKKYRCEASRLNIEDIGSEANINYQMLQTLVGMEEWELKELAKPTIEVINKVGTDKNTMLELLGATKENKNKNSLQEALLLYPELLNDKHSRELIKNNRLKLIKEAKAGKLKVNGHYTFIIPDLYAFCEWLFLGDKEPKGLLKNLNVYCNIFNEGEVDVLRAPHLYKEHAVRNNVLNEDIAEWFITQGIYTSVHDPISRILQFDNDGDKALVIQDKTLIDVAKREMDGVLPLYYNMKKATDELITPKNIYNALTKAYEANIGIISNDITKIWNHPKPDVKAVKFLTMYNNFVIDYAKTLYKPKFSKEAAELIKSFTKNKLPHFFKYAKDKEYYKPEKIKKKDLIEKLLLNRNKLLAEKKTLHLKFYKMKPHNKKSQVEECNMSTVNKLEYLIPNDQIKYKRIVGKIDHRYLMKRNKAPHNQDIIDIYEAVSRRKRFILTSHDDKKNASKHFDTIMKEELKSSGKRIDLIVDILIDYLYTNDKPKENLWSAYGNIIVENLKEKLKDTKSCEKCLERFKTKQRNEKYCSKCKIAIKKEQDKKSDQKRRKTQKSC